MTDGSQTDTGTVTGDAALTASNIGGIDRAQVEFSPGVTVLTGYNVTNRTSLLRAVNGVLGGTEATLKSSADEGEVSLTIGDETYTRSYRRTGSGVATSGEPFTDSETLVDLFVSLFEDNEVRRTVARGEDLHDVVMRPVDTAAIERRIRELQTEREELKREQERVAERRNELPELEQRRGEIDERIETRVYRRLETVGITSDVSALTIRRQIGCSECSPIDTVNGAVRPVARKISVVPEVFFQPIESKVKELSSVE
jgi:hypothetical protein